MNRRIPHSTPWLSLLSLCLLLPVTPASYSQTAYSQKVLADEPLLYWSFDEERPGPLQHIPTPPVTSENTLLPTGNVTKVSHEELGSGLRLGRAAAFDGASFLRAPGALRAGPSALTGAWAIELWVQSLGPNGGTYPLNFGSIPGGDNSPAVIYNFQGPVVELFGGGSRTGAGGPVLEDEEWHHIVVVYYGDGVDGVAPRTDIYFDGELYTGLDFVSKRLSLAGLMVGAGLPDFANAFTGNIDEVAVYTLDELEDEAAVETWAATLVDRHRSAAMAETGPSYTSVVQEDKPLLYLSFDEETPESTIQVLHPSGLIEENRLLPYGTPFQVAHTDIDSGLQLGRAAELDGSSFFHLAPVVTGLEGNRLNAPFAVELWFQSLSSNNGTYLMNFGPGGGNSPAIIYNFDANPTFLEFFGQGRTGQSGPTFTDDKWHHLFIVYYGDGVNGVDNRLDIYFDRVPFTSAAVPPSQLALDQLFVGAALLNRANAFTGRLDEVAIYDLSSAGDAEAIEAKVTEMINSHFELAGAVPAAAQVVITSPPASVTAEIGQTVTFSVTAQLVNAEGDLSYQWFKDGELIPGAQEDSYTIPEVTLTDVGTHAYTVRVAAAGVFTVSEPTTLTVAAPPAPAPTAYSAQVLSDRPLLYWNFDEVTGPAVERVGGVNELVPTTFAGRDQHSRLGSGLFLGHTADFQGNGHYKGLLNTDIVELQSPFGLELWFQSTAPNPGTYLANFGDHTIPGRDNSPAVIYNFGGFENHLELFLNGLRTGLEGPFLEDDQWHHLFFAYYGNGEAGVAPVMEIYLDGEVYEIANTIAWRVDLAGLVVGAALPNGVNSFTGRIDELALYNFEDAADEVSLRSRVQDMISRHRSAAAGIIPAPATPPELNITVSGGNAVLTWSNAEGYVLQESTSLATGSWTTIQGATSPHTVPLPTNGQKFYRLAKP